MNITHFRISAPASINIFGEHAKNRLRASIDLRTTLIFQEVPTWFSDDIQIYFPQIKLLHLIPLQNFLNFYNYCVENIELLHERVLQLPFQYESINQKIFLQIFYYLLILITYKEQIVIKTFNIHLTTQIVWNRQALASIKVCLVGCLLHWSRLQKGAHSTFDDIDLDKICAYAMWCKIIAPRSDLIDIIVCTYGSVMKFNREQDMYEGFRLPSMTILLVDSNQTQDVEAQKQRVAELMNIFPEFANFMLDNIDDVTNMAFGAFQTFFDNCRNNAFSNEMRINCFLQLHKALEICTRMNQILLQLLNVSYYHLDKICDIAREHGSYGKYTDFNGNGRCAYIWCSSYTSVTNVLLLINELKTHGFNVIQTNLLCVGVKIE